MEQNTKCIWFIVETFEGIDVCYDDIQYHDCSFSAHICPFQTHSKVSLKLLSF